MSATVTWNDQWLRRQEEAAGRRVRAAAVYLVGEIRKAISTPSRTVTIAGGRKRLGPRGSNRSRPGEPPHKDYGTLRQSITFVFDPSVAAALVGTALKYGRYLELGTSRMAPRPYLRATLKLREAEVLAIVRGGGGGGGAAGGGTQVAPIDPSAVVVAKPAGGG